MVSGAEPFTEPEWKVPGYTGFVPGIAETYKKTPIMAQLETREPSHDSFIYTRTASPPCPVPARDPCNFPQRVQKGEPGNLWASLQTRAAQDSFKPPASTLALGDERICPFATSYGQDFSAPFDSQSRLRSPMRNKDLAATTTSLCEHYASSHNRVGDKRLAKMIATMRERMSAKMGNANDNAFRMRKLFKMYDRGSSGMIHFEDFRMMGESFGMQLDDDSLLALYCVHDPQGTGYLAYEEIVRQLLDPDYYSMYSPDQVNNTQSLADDKADAQLAAHLRRRVRCESGADMRSVFQSFDANQGGSLPPYAFAAACASMGIVLSPKEQEWLGRIARAKEDGSITYGAFCDALDKQQEQQQQQEQR